MHQRFACQGIDDSCRHWHLHVRSAAQALHAASDRPPLPHACLASPVACGTRLHLEASSVPADQGCHRRPGLVIFDRVGGTAALLLHPPTRVGSSTTKASALDIPATSSQTPWWRSVRCCDRRGCIIVFPTTPVTGCLPINLTHYSPPSPTTRHQHHHGSPSSWIYHQNALGLARSSWVMPFSRIGRMPRPAPTWTTPMSCKRRTLWRRRYGSFTSRRKPSCPTRSGWRT